jgi:hypothetical protein
MRGAVPPLPQYAFMALYLFTFLSFRLIKYYEVRIWVEAAVTYFKILSQHHPEETEENHETPH